jgi:trehalose synthase-fused probable maltokinase
MGPMAEPSDTAPSLDVDWLRGRRWFRSKARQLIAVETFDVARLDAASWLLVLAARFADGPDEHYLVPAAQDDGARREPRDGDGTWLALIARLAADPPVIAARHGSFELHPTDALGTFLATPLDPGLAERAFSVEQSNTSVRIGDTAVLKIYRLLEPGINPEVEIGEFLTAHGFAHAPSLGGHVVYRFPGGQDAAAAMVQQLVPSRGDGWDWALRHLADGGDPNETLAGLSQIGGLTAEMHAVLASDPDNADFPSRPATTEEGAAWLEEAGAQLDGALAAVRDAQRDRLERLEPGIRRALQPLADAEDAPVSRIHGDYHLGQLLRTANGFAILDFEGEPARPLAERRRPSSPLRDVAGMLRSIDYAGRTAERQAQGSLDADGWVADAQRAFLNAYGLDGAEPELLTAFEVQKACYEVRYEANNRPDWVWLPLEALERLTG